MADDSRIPWEITQQFATRYIETATRAWFVLILGALIVTLPSLARSAKFSQLFAVTFFAALVLAFTFINVRKTVQRAWETDQMSALYRGFILVYFSAVVAGWITMLLFWKAISESSGVETAVMPIYGAAFTWGALLVAYRNRLRRPLARSLTDFYMTKYGPPIPGFGLKIDLKLARAKRWHPLSVASAFTILVGFIIADMHISDVVSRAGSVLLLLGIVGLLARGGWWLGSMCLRRKQIITGVLFVGTIRDGAIPLNFRFESEDDDPKTITAEIVLMRSFPGNYERECEQFGNFAAEMPMDVHTQTATLPVFLPKLPITVSDRQWLRYVLRVKVETPRGQWATKESMPLTSVAVQVDSEATPATA